MLSEWRKILARQRWCTVGRVHRDRSCTPCVTVLTPPPHTVGSSAFYSGLEDASCPRSTINSSIIVSSLCSIPDDKDSRLSRRLRWDTVNEGMMPNVQFFSLFCCQLCILKRVCVNIKVLLWEDFDVHSFETFSIYVMDWWTDLCIHLYFGIYLGNRNSLSDIIPTYFVIKYSYYWCSLFFNHLYWLAKIQSQRS